MSNRIQPGKIYAAHSEAEVVEALTHAEGWSVAFALDEHGHVGNTALVLDNDTGYQAEFPTVALDKFAALFPPALAAPLLEIHARFLAEQAGEETCE